MRSYSCRPLLFAFLVVAVACHTAPALSQHCGPFEVAKLLAADTKEQDQLGGAVSVSGNTAVIGAIKGDGNAPLSGAAYVFRFNGASWVQESKLVADDGDTGDEFGRAVSISGDTIIIGAIPGNLSGSSTGAAYVYRFDGTEWVQEAKLVANDSEPGDFFCSSVSVSDDLAIMGAASDTTDGISTGSAYIYRFDGVNWVQETKLLPDDGGADDLFGWSVSISDNIAVAGAFRNEDFGSGIGSAYVFRFDGTGWVQETKLLPDDGPHANHFGFSVSVSGDTVLVGAMWDSDIAAGAGAAYIFRFDDVEWVQESKLRPDEGSPQDFFGRSVSISGDTAVIGVPRDDDAGNNSGSAYVFRFDGAQWVHEAKVVSPRSTQGDSFGDSVSVSGNTAVMGASGSDGNVPDSGSAYIYDIYPDLCLPDINCDGSVTPTDFTAWINAFNSNLPACDQNSDGSCTPTDFTAWVTNFNAGC
ncbi:MAG: FG-GAP repeat protein [Phycisphaerales bacterium]